MTVAKNNGKTTMTTTTNIFIEDEKKLQNNALLSYKEEETEDDEITLEDLAPDGGWGWMVALAMILIFVSITYYDLTQSSTPQTSQDAFIFSFPLLLHFCKPPLLCTVQG